MKRLLFSTITIIISIVIPIYFLLVWEPLKSEEVISENVVKYNKEEEFISEEKNKSTIIINQVDSSNNLFGHLDKARKEKINVLIRNLAIVDIIKVNDYFSYRENTVNITKGMSLVKQRMSNKEYEEFKDIISDYIDLDIIEKEV
ncbi:hypothetical protein ACH36K_18140 [Clostridium sp. MB05]|jgi:hypothetical protein|uniref:hypothetical protein n=1 Tax=Clostridium sp. MB05 TaxID=3376682 RepID=UPI0039821C7B